MIRVRAAKPVACLLERRGVFVDVEDHPSILRPVDGTPDRLPVCDRSPLWSTIRGPVVAERIGVGAGRVAGDGDPDPLGTGDDRHESLRIVGGGEHRW